MNDTIIERVCRALCEIERDTPVDALCYNAATGEKNTPAWQFGRRRVEEAIEAIERAGGKVVFLTS